MKIANHRLEITFADGNALTTPRFDHTGFITRVILDEKYSFCTKEQFIAGRRNSGGEGLCGEFVLATGELAKAGEWFYKPGTGLVKQTADHQRFNIFGTYELKSFPVTAEILDEHTVRFIQKGIECNGYCTDIVKTYSLQDNQLILNIEVANTGSNEIELSEYQHNFMNIENLPIGPGYRLTLPCDEELSKIENSTLRWGDEFPLDSAVVLKGDTIHWTTDMNSKVLYHESTAISKTEPYRWILQHEASNLSITEEVNFTPSMVIIWGVEHVICAEFYRTVKLLPGETSSWQRTWTFHS